MPLNISSLYIEYKVDTTTLATWLAASGRLCQCPNTLVQSVPENEAAISKSRRLKGKARVEAKTNNVPKKNVLLMANFVPLAKYIVNCTKPKVNVSHAVISALDRAISMRKKYSIIIESRSPQTEKTDGQRETHAHFVEILERVRDILAEHCKPSSTQPDMSTATNEQQPNLDNGFQTLHLEDCEDTTFTPLPTLSSSTTCISSTDSVIYEAEEKPTKAEALFRFQLLLGDLYRIRSVVMDAWQDYSSHKLDLAAVATMTNTAIDLARRLEDDFRPFLASLPQLDVDDNIEPFGLPNETLTTQELEDFRREVKHSPYLEVFECMTLTYERKIKTTDPEWSTMKDRPDAQDHLWRLTQDRYYHQLSGQMVFAFKALVDIHQELLNRWKKGQGRTYAFEDLEINLEQEWNHHGMKGSERVSGENSLLCAFFYDALNYVQHSQFREVIPVPDGVLRSVEVFAETKVLDLRTIFAGQIYLDIHNTIAPLASLPLQDLRTFTKLSLDTLAEIGDSDDPTFTNHQKTVEMLSNRLTIWMNDPIGTLKHPTTDTTLGVDTKIRDFFLSRHPLLCGVMLNFLRGHITSLGFQIEADSGAIKAIAHVYNACKQEGLIESTWPDMELLMTELQGYGSFFFGEKPPASFDSYLKAYNLAEGVSVTTLAARKRQVSARSTSSRLPAMQRRNNPGKSLSRPDPITASLHERDWGKSQKSILTDEDIELIIKTPKKWNWEYGYRTAHQVGHDLDPKAPWNNRATLPLVEVLREVISGVESETAGLAFSYPFMVLLSCRLLAVIRSCIIQVCPEYEHHSVSNRLLVRYLFSTVGKEHMYVAAAAIRSFLEHTGGNQVINMRFDNLTTTGELDYYEKTIMANCCSCCKMALTDPQHDRKGDQEGGDGEEGIEQGDENMA
ncbi:hypothetical protein B0T17DRAFT_507327 [Bombardia bombarda]|uniref:DUF6604 domain-containing protein n=1 Tax=Bombardia bombarda TaxID=252184 RepID=A0AA39XBJ8_9PEZI|nr:hypothetical protein B0T17DRAFT_507327 [Bombardia bombarda]